MQSQRHEDAILNAVRLSTIPLDDDELARRTAITPRQTVNQICRKLAKTGRLVRRMGPDGKLVNVLAEPAEPQPPPRVLGQRRRSEPEDQAVEETAGTLPAGHTSEQREAEGIMLTLLGERLGKELRPTRLLTQGGARVELDGADAERTVLIECWAHQGSPKVAQKHKVLTDALKLTWIASTMPVRPRLILCLSDALAAAPFQPTAAGWGARALADFGVSIEVVDLPAEIRSRIVAAQKRQYR